MTAIRLGTGVLIAAAVLSFGGVESWGNAALEIGAALLFVLWAVLVTLRGRAEIFWNWLLIPVFGLGAIALVQYTVGAFFRRDVGRRCHYYCCLRLCRLRPYFSRHREQGLLSWCWSLRCWRFFPGCIEEGNSW